MDVYLLQNDETPLYTAASKGHIDLVKLLVENKAVINTAKSVSRHIHTQPSMKDRAASTAKTI